jgi:tripartite-type tricarboxylate transporter receptor subunit TctC
MMLATADSHTIAPLLRSNLGFDAAADFEPVYLVATLSFSMVARPGLEASTPQDIVAMAGAGDGLTVGTWGVGSTAHIAAEMFNQATGVSLVHVPYQGSAPAINDLQNDQIDVMFLGPGTVTSSVEAGTMRFIGAASASRIGLAPDFPTMKEQGIEDVEMQTWFGIMGPDGLPDEAVAWWDVHMETLMQDPAFLDLLRTRGMDPVGEGPEAFQAFMDDQSAKLGAVIEKAGITVE